MAIQISKYLLFLLPVSLISGPFISEIFMNIISIIFLFYLINNNELKLYFNNAVVKMVFIFYVICLISSFFSSYFEYSLKTSVPYIRFLIFAIAASWLIHSDNSILKKIFYSLVFCYLILIIFAFLEHFTNYNIIYGDQFRKDRLSSLFGDELILGSYLSRFFPLLVGLGISFIHNEKNYIKFLFFTIIILTPVIVFLSGERTSFFFMIIGFLGFLILFRFDTKIKFLITVSILILIVGFLTLSENVKKNSFDRTLKQITPSSNKIHFFSDEHEALANSAIKIFKDNVFLGSGTKTFRKKCLEADYEVKNDKKIFGCYTHPHNTFLQILSETGVIGFLIPFILLIFILFKLINFFIKLYFYKETNISSIKICCYLSFLITLFPIVPGANFFNNYINMIYYYPMGIFLALNINYNFNEKNI